MSTVSLHSLRFDHAYRATPPESGAARVVPVDPRLLDTLKELRRTFVEEHGREPGPGDFVFGEAIRSRTTAQLEAQAWIDFRLWVPKSAPPALALRSLRVTGAMERWTRHETDLRRVAYEMGHRPPQFFPGEDPPGFLRRYLPVYGESSHDEMVRAAGDMPRFGRWAFGRRTYDWFLNRRRSHEGLFQLFWFLDGERACAYDFTLNEARAAISRFRLPAIVEEISALPWTEEITSFDWLTELEGELEGYEETLDDLAKHWIARCFGEAWSGHVCGIVPILPHPDSSGVYFLKSRAPNDMAVAVKIGWGKNIANRIRDLGTAHPWPLDLLAHIEGASLQDEHALHEEFASLRIEDSPGREWFRLTGALVERIQRLRGDA